MPVSLKHRILTFSIEYAKKKDKRATIKVQKDEMVRGDATYKSSTIHVGSGEPPNSGELAIWLITFQAHIQYRALCHPECLEKRRHQRPPLPVWL